MPAQGDTQRDLARVAKIEQPPMARMLACLTILNDHGEVPSPERLGWEEFERNGPPC